MNIEQYLQTDPPEVIKTLPKMSYALATVLHSSGELAMAITCYPTPPELLSNDIYSENEMLYMVAKQEILCQVLITSKILKSQMFVDCYNQVVGR